MKSWRFILGLRSNSGSAATAAGAWWRSLATDTSRTYGSLWSKEALSTNTNNKFKSDSEVKPLIVVNSTCISDQGLPGEVIRTE
ncbi:hypothetical protein SLA2020_509140 [Shorea laevis]